MDQDSDVMFYLRLGRRADTGHGETDVDGRTDTTEEQLSLQEELAISVGNDLCGEGQYLTYRIVI